MSHNNKNYGGFFKNPQKEESVNEKPVEKIQPAPKVPEESEAKPAKEEVKEVPKPKNKPKFAVVVNAKRVNMRADISIDAPVVMVLNQGMKVEVLDTNSNKTWTKIRFKNANGYMMSKFLKAVM